MLGLCEGVFWKGDLWVLKDKNGMGSVFDWIVDFSILCLYSLYHSLLSLICFFFFLTYFSPKFEWVCLSRHTISCPATLLFFQCKFVFFIFIIISFPLIFFALKSLLQTTLYNL
jgi:hypothetical protein